MWCAHRSASPQTGAVGRTAGGSNVGKSVDTLMNFLKVILNLTMRPVFVHVRILGRGSSVGRSAVLSAALSMLARGGKVTEGGD